MCGIAGYLISSRKFFSQDSVIAAMLATLNHRGPDDNGIWHDNQAGVVLGHCRLSVLDLSPTGHQPMSSSCGRYIIVYNGEIYNHNALRMELEKKNQVPAQGWRGHSDTETLLECISTWGIHKTLQSVVGMFAFALWDKKDCTLTLARDRIGEKPLYLGWQNGVFLFASELKTLRKHPAFEGKTDWNVANMFLHLGYIPAPFSIYKNIQKLLPGSYLRMCRKHVQQRTLPVAETYWSLSSAALNGEEKTFAGDIVDAGNELRRLLNQAVKQQSIADVPVGAFLSGGIDSSMIVALMQAETSSKVTTFSIGMPVAKMDETRHAAAVANHLGTNHVEHTILAEEALELIPRLPEIWDEPFADSSQIPTYLVSQIAKQQVTVALSGDGGDEFFLGYPQYAFYQQMWKFKRLEHLPWNAFFSFLEPFQNIQAVSMFMYRGKSLIEAWRQPNPKLLNRYWMSKFRKCLNPSKINAVFQSGWDMPVMHDPAVTAGVADAASYLPDDILVKVDRASMAVSLETRAPFLDHRIIEFALSLPVEFKLDRGIGKKVLRELLYEYVPRQIVDRPKMGFSIPISTWLRNELRPWAENLLREIPTDSNFFSKAVIEKLWQEHLSGRREHGDQMWVILNLLEYTKM